MVGGEGEGVQPHGAGALLDGAGQHVPYQSLTSREVRVAFDVDVTSEVVVAQRAEESGLVRAIEEGGEAEGAAPLLGMSRKVWLAAALFLLALAVGFLLVWLLG
jgi:serine/threonine-protein kinase